MTTPTRVFGFLVATATFLALGVGAAGADEPASAAWPDGEGRSVLDTLLLFGGGTIGLFLLIALFGLLTARNNYTPPPPSTELATTSSSAATHH